MSKKIQACFNIYLNDNFEDSVRAYFDYPDDEEIDGEDIRQFLENNMILASSQNSSFEVEGGDTDGWFIQCANICEH